MGREPACRDAPGRAPLASRRRARRAGLVGALAAACAAHLAAGPGCTGGGRVGRDEKSGATPAGPKEGPATVEERPVARVPDGAPPVVKEIVAEALRSSSDPSGRPLPLAAHWNRGTRPAGFGPPYQLELIEKGHHLLPWFQFPDPNQPPDADAGYYADAYFGASLRKCAAWKLPVTFVGTQWEYILGASEAPGGPYPWRTLPPGENPNVIGLDGTVRPELGISPFGPLGPWREAGAAWIGTPMWKRIQEAYPDPPLVILLSNNEAHKLRWAKNGGVEQSGRYVDAHGKGRDDDFKRKVVGDGWIERYRAMLGSMRDGFVAPAWRENARFVGYESFGPPHLGRWGGWAVYSLHCGGRIDPGPYAWDGGSPSYYTHDWNSSTDYRVHSPQVESQNWVFMQEQVARDRPGFWFEISVWDGDRKKQRFYEEQGQRWTPERYAGFVQFGMWLLTPRVVREFRGYLDTRERVGAFFEAIVRAVDRVHADPVLTSFWRTGELVPNRAHEHPYRAGVPDEYANVDRWFLLDTSLDPERPWKLETELPVFALARVVGVEPEREWLLYAHSPLGERAGVVVTLPGFGKLPADVSVRGSFYHVKEAGRSVRAVGSE